MEGPIEQQSKDPGGGGGCVWYVVCRGRPAAPCGREEASGLLGVDVICCLGR
jgi:hypothetical protein